MSSAQRSIAPDSSSHATSDAVTAPSVGQAATGSRLVRTILESYSKDILESASEQFLDLAVEVRLQKIYQLGYHVNRPLLTCSPILD